MKTPTNKQTKRTSRVIIIIVATLLLLAGCAAYAYATNIFGWNPDSSNSTPTTPDIDYEAPTPEQVKDGNATKDNNAESNPETQVPSGDSSTKKNVSVLITVSQQTSSTYQIRTILETVTNTGTCMLVLKSSAGTTVSKTTGVQAQSSSSTCEGFDIPLSELSRGVWSYSLTFENTTTTGTATGNITVK